MKLAAVWLLTLLTILPTLAGAQPDARNESGAAASEPADFVLPRTIRPVWYRGEKTRAGGFAFSGDLTINEQGLEFTGRKRQFSIPLEQIEVLSFGKMRGDLDNDWIIFAVRNGSTRKLYGFRDGRRFGFGKRTEEIYEFMRDAMRRLRAAQYRVPEGFQTFDQIDSQFTLALPESWSIRLPVLAELDAQTMLGTLLVTAASQAEPVQRPEEGAEETVVRLLQRMHSGELRGFIVEWREATRGMSCSGFSKKAAAQLDIRALRYLEAAGAGAAEPLEESLAYCAGRRWSTKQLELQAVSDGRFVVIFGANPQLEERGVFDAFRKMLSSFRFSANGRRRN